MGQSVRALGLVIGRKKEQSASNGGDRGSVTRLQGVPLSLHLGGRGNINLSVKTRGRYFLIIDRLILKRTCKGSTDTDYRLQDTSKVIVKTGWHR